MKLQLVLVAFSLLGVSPAQADDSIAYRPQREVAQYEGYRLVWSDEFDKDGKPSGDWEYEKGFVRNQELQWYQEDNAFVKDGVLVIEGRREDVRNPYYRKGSSDWAQARPQAHYTSSSITTRKSHSFRYGRFEVRAKIPTASGSWPAIWLLGNQWGWPENGEIDMMEFYIKNGKQSVLANTCWGSTKRFAPVWNSTVTPLEHFTSKDAHWAEKFHVWRMDWDERFIRIYLDGELLNETDLSKTVNGGVDGNRQNPFSNQVDGFGDYILLNLAIGENGGVPDDSQFPLRYCVDYVRVYEKCPVVSPIERKHLK